METARAEMRRYFTVGPDCGFVWAVVRLNLARVVDLTKKRPLQQFGIRSLDLVGGDYAACQELGLRPPWTVHFHALPDHAAFILPAHSSPAPRRR